MSQTPDTTAGEHKRAFMPAKPNRALIATMQFLASIDLWLANRVHIDDADLEKLRNLPPGVGVVLAPNHADEIDPRVCLELARRCGRQFIFMCNREAFDEWGGFAGRCLQAVGCFSVERGAHDLHARDYAIDVLKQARDVLVIFPEGEIFYLNEAVQPFHSGSVDLCMQAMIQKRATQPDFAVYVVPMAIKYTYPKSIDRILDKHMKKLEKILELQPATTALQPRLQHIFRELLTRQQQAHDIQMATAMNQRLSQQLQRVRRGILEQLEAKYSEGSSGHRRTIDESWQLGARLREMIAEGASNKTDIRKDLSALHEVAHLASWQPKYIVCNPSNDRMAEVLLKMERELYHLKRPKQLTGRNVYLRIADPVDLSTFLAEYERDGRTFSHSLTESLHDTIQGMIDLLIPVAHLENQKK